MRHFQGIAIISCNGISWYHRHNIAWYMPLCTFLVLLVLCYATSKSHHIASFGNLHMHKPARVYCSTSSRYTFIYFFRLACCIRDGSCEIWGSLFNYRRLQTADDDGPVCQLPFIWKSRQITATMLVFAECSCAVISRWYIEREERGMP
jgi:hypothetical protein